MTPIRVRPSCLVAPLLGLLAVLSSAADAHACLLSPCSITGYRDLGAPQISLCDQTTVQLLLPTATCPAKPLGVTLLIDRSVNTRYDGFELMKARAAAIVDALDLPRHPFIQVALISHGDRPEHELGYTNDAEAIKARIQALRHTSESSLPEAIAAAEGPPDGQQGARRLPAGRVVVAMVDGDYDGSIALARAAARAKADQLFHVITVCSPTLTGDCSSVGSVATDPSLALRTDQDDPLVLFRVLAGQMQDVTMSGVVWEETIPDGLTFVPGSADPPATFDPAARTLLWSKADLAAPGVSVRYDVEAAAPGSYTLNGQGWVTDSLRERGEVYVGWSRLVVVPTCPPPTPLPTAPPVPSATSTPSLPMRNLFIPAVYRQLPEAASPLGQGSRIQQSGTPQPVLPPLCVP